MHQKRQVDAGIMESGVVYEIEFACSSRLNVIASRLGLPARTVAEVTEPFLIRVGLVMKDDQGKRNLTAEGRNHLSKSR